MGRLEKIVVLTVLFLVAVVLGVALTPTGEGTSRDGGRSDRSAPDDLVGPAENLDPDAKPPGLLTAETNFGQPKQIVEPKATGPQGAVPEPVVTPPPLPTPTPVPQPIPTPPPAKFLLTTEGLEPSGGPDAMLYTWKQGDTLAALAQRYYGSPDKVGRLQKANEGRSDSNLRVDDRLWVPVEDKSPAASALGDDRVYVVKKGDVLGTISQHYYGTSKKWQKILDANRDTLSGPERLRPGMRLRIPE